MEEFGGGWTVLQRRINGSVSFNRTWADYKRALVTLKASSGLAMIKSTCSPNQGHDPAHWAWRFEGTRGYAKYEQFYVSNEFLNYRLSLSGYSGLLEMLCSLANTSTMIRSSSLHRTRTTTCTLQGTVERTTDRGWWFDACMSANLNGKFYKTKYKGKRDGIFWGTWHNLTSEYYLTNYRQTFKNVKMMIRPKNYAP